MSDLALSTYTGPPWSPYQLPAWQQTLAKGGNFLSQVLMALDPAQGLTYMIGEQPSVRRFRAAHPVVSDVLQNLTTLGLGGMGGQLASGHFGSPGGLSDDEAMSLANEQMPHIEKIASKAVRDPAAREDAKQNGWLMAYELAKKHTGTKEEFGPYFRASFARELKYDPTHATDALDRQTTGLTRTTDEGEELEHPALRVDPSVSSGFAAEAAEEGATQNLLPQVGETSSTALAGQPAPSGGDLRDYIKSLKGSSQGQTGKLQAMARDYFLRGVPTSALQSRYRVSQSTIADIINGISRAGTPTKSAPFEAGLPPDTGPIDISKAIQGVYSKNPDLLQQKIDALPPNLVALARKYILEGKPFDTVARETGRTSPQAKATLKDNITDLINRLSPKK